MDVNKLTIVLLAGDVKCHRSIPPHGKETYLQRAFWAASEIHCPVVLVRHRDFSFPGFRYLRQVLAGETLYESLKAGLAACETEYILVLATDLPLINAAAIRQFLDEASATDTDIAIAFAYLSTCQNLGYSTSHPIPLKGGPYKFGSAFLIRTEARERMLTVVKELLELRKQPFRLVRRLLSSLRFFPQIVRFALSQRYPYFSLSLVEAGRIVEQQVGIRVRALVASPYLAIDDD